MICVAETKSVKSIIAAYQDRLNDLSKRNRSIRLSRIIKRKTFDFDVDQLNIPVAISPMEQSQSGESSTLL